MRKIILSFILALGMVSTGLAFSPAVYEVKESLNVRSTPHLGNNRIDYFQKGTVITVTEIEKGEWCKVHHYKYPEAYVRCRYLQVTDKEYVTPLPTPAKIKELLTQAELPYSSPDKLLKQTFIGTRRAVVDTNVRSTPRLANNLIGYIQKGTDIEITGLDGNWCRLQYKNYSQAYVYCSLLGITNFEEFIKNSRISSNPNQSEKPKLKFSVATKKLDELYHWTIDNDEAGRFYINNSGKVGLEKAKKWQADAVRAGFRFDFPRKLEGYCVYNFVSVSDPDKVFQYHCAEPGSEGSSKIVPKHEVSYVGKKTPSDFKVPFAALVTRMLDGNGRVWPLLQGYFADSQKVQMEFTLSTDEQGTFWTVRIYDEEGAMIKLMLNGTDAEPSFLIFEGNITED